MRWSWRILRVAGIGVHVHVTFLLLPLWVGFAGFSERHQWADALIAVLFILVLFAIVVLHELGHALTARRFGIRTRDITLLPIGGVARLDRIPENPRQELLVALAGPAVNVCLAVLLFAVVGAGSQIAEWGNTELLGAGFLVALMWVNVAMAVFNMVPAFPMDGGRVLRALLARRSSYLRATNVAAAVGQGIAILFAFVGFSSFFNGPMGIFSNPFLVFIALFVWMGASQEAGLVRLKSALGGVPVSSLMITEFRTLSPDEPLSRAAEYMLAGWQHDFPVVEHGSLVGLLTRSALVSGLAQRGASALVGDAMLRQFSTIDPDATAEAALSRLRTGEEPVLVAASDSRLLGMISRDRLGEYLMLKSALKP